MKPNERAKNLVEDFKATRMDILTTQDSVPCVMSDYPTFKTAKKCALITVENLIKENEEIEGMVGQHFNLDYWKEVQDEIVKL